MPNWSSNALILTPLNDQGIKDIADYIEEVKSTTQDEFNGLFSKRFPRPESVVGDGGAACNWSCKNWGTKWDTSIEGWDAIEIIDESDTHFHMVFDTAWAPPMKYVERLSEQLPNVRFEIAYSEQGMAFAGTAVIQNGQTLSESEVAVTWDTEYDDDECEHEGDNYVDPAPSGEWAALMEKYSIGMGG